MNKWLRMTLVNALRDSPQNKQSNRQSHLLELFFLVLISCFLSWPVCSQGLNNLSIDPKALTLGNAVTADPPGLSAIHYNPAALTNQTGRRSDISFLSQFLSLDAEFSAPNGYQLLGFANDPLVCANANNEGGCTAFKVAQSELDGIQLYLPILEDDLSISTPWQPPIPINFAWSWNKSGSKWTFATAFYAPTLFGYRRDAKDPGRFWGKEFTLEKMTYFSPAIAYRLNQQWSIGVTLQFSYNALLLNTDIRQANEVSALWGELSGALCGIEVPAGGSSVTGISELCQQGISPFLSMANIQLESQNSFTPTYHIGILWQPIPAFSWGAVWQSGANSRLSGDFDVNYPSTLVSALNSITSTSSGRLLTEALGVNGFVNAHERGRATVLWGEPAHFQTGFKWRLHPKWQVNLDVSWTDYEQFSHVKILLDRPFTLTALGGLPFSPDDNALILPLEYENARSWGVGIQFSASSRLYYRFGFESRESVMAEEQFNLLVPIGESKLVGFGASYQWDRYTELDFSIASLFSKETLPANTRCNLNCVDLDSRTYNPYAGLDVSSEMSNLFLGFSIRNTF